MKRTRDERIDLAEKICDLYSLGLYTLDSCCKAVGVAHNTFRQWACPYLDNWYSLSPNKQKELLRRGYVHHIHTLYKQSKLQNEISFKEILLNASREGLLKKVTGYTYETVYSRLTEDEEGNKKEIPIRKVLRHVQPDITAIIFALTNLDKENFSGNTLVR